ncbi:MAG: twin-arginine translocation signal domain-containing protein [Bacteroidales bacterium]|nr:twin-arginine translocation signal domain-containing protein [Candidatus Cryptobacteroides faecihippi]
MDRREFLKTSALGLALAGTGSLSGCRFIRPRTPFDTLIKGGFVLDGSGKPGFVGDVGIRDGLVAAVGRNLGSNADHLVDAGGYIVSPDSSTSIPTATRSTSSLREETAGSSRVSRPRSEATAAMPRLSTPMRHGRRGRTGKSTASRHGGRSMGSMMP